MTISAKEKPLLHVNINVTRKPIQTYKQFIVLHSWNEEENLHTLVN